MLLVPISKHDLPYTRQGLSGMLPRGMGDDSGLPSIFGTDPSTLEPVYIPEDSPTIPTGQGSSSPIVSSSQIAQNVNPPIPVIQPTNLTGVTSLPGTPINVAAPTLAAGVLSGLGNLVKSMPTWVWWLGGGLFAVGLASSAGYTSGSYKVVRKK